MSEQQIVRAVVEAVNASGLAKVWRSQSGVVKIRGGFMHLAPKGSPDIVGYTLDGRATFLGIEVKKPKRDGGHTNPDQVEAQGKWRDALTQAGAIWVRAETVDDVLRVLRERRAA